MAFFFVFCLLKHLDVEYMSLALPVCVLVGGIAAITVLSSHGGTTWDAGNDGPISSRDIARKKCSNPNQGNCLRKEDNLYVADYPNDADALLILKRMDAILKRLQQQFKKVLLDAGKIDPKNKVAWANTQGLKVTSSNDLDWQLQRIQQFLQRIPNVTIGEVIKQSKNEFTSYVIDKRDLSLCLRNKSSNELYADSLVTYVFLHELGHIMSPTIGHDETFVKCFQIVLRMAVFLHLYVQVDWSRNPIHYCDGVYLNSTVWA